MFKTAAKQQLETQTEIGYTDYIMEFQFYQNLPFNLHIFKRFCLTNMQMLLH